GNTFYIDLSQCSCVIILFCRITKPLTFADCVGDELPLGWETVYDKQIGVYYMDHINKLTQIEDPREQWRREQERMLKEYLIVAQEALNAKKEIYQIKQQRFELAQEEYQQLHKMCEDDSRSHASSFSGYSTNTKYDPHQIKAEIASRRDRLSRLKRELTQMKQELQYKEKGVETLQEIDRKMSSTHTSYKLDEAQAIMSELRTIKKAICTGEKERRDLMHSLAKLTDSFKNSCSVTDSLVDFPHHAGVPGDAGLPQQFCDAGSQTDIIGEFVFDDKTRLVDRVRLNWQYEEARKRVANIQQQLARLDNESWPGTAEADRDRLQLIKEKEALMQELQLIIAQRRSAGDVARLEEERERLEEELRRARATSAQGATERLEFLKSIKKKVNSLGLGLGKFPTTNCFLGLVSVCRQICSAGVVSAPGVLCDKIGEMFFSSKDDACALLPTDLCMAPFGILFASGETKARQNLCCLPVPHPPSHTLTHPCAHSSSHASPPPCPVPGASTQSSRHCSGYHKNVLNIPFRQALDNLCSDFFLSLPPLSHHLLLKGLRFQNVSLLCLEHCGLSLAPASLSKTKSSSPGATGLPAVTLREDSAKRLERRARRISACLSDYSLASDSGVFEPLTKRNEDAEEPAYGDTASNGDPQIHVGLLRDSGNECLLVHVLQLKNPAGLAVKEDCKVHIRVYLPPLDLGTPNTYCSKALEFQVPLVFNEVFRIPVHSSALTLKSLQLYVCSVTPQLQEELLGIAQINLADYDSLSEMQLRWHSVQVFTSSEPSRTREPGSVFVDVSQYSEDAVTVLLARTTAQLQAVERELAEERAKLEYTEEEVLEMERKEEQTEAVSERCTVTLSLGEKSHVYSACEVDKETNTEDLFPEEAASLLKERSSRRARGSPFVRSGTIVRSQTFSPGARSQYVCRLYRSDSDSSTLPRKSPFIRNTLERRTLRYKQHNLAVEVSHSRSSLAELMARTSLDLELDLQASRTRQRQLNEELCALRELRQRLEDAQLRGQTDLPPWVLRDERLRGLLREAERQTRQTKLDYRHEQAAEKMLKKASKEIYQLRGQSHKEPIQVQTFSPREKIAFFTRPRINIPPLPADDV
ncbi:hypothetical protein EGK_20262, partial [Macaca mulatta]